MKITKFGHCCLLVETKCKKILTDPGSYTIESHSKLENLDYILFTHEHADHYHLESLKIILERNHQVQVYANDSVSELLKKEGINHTRIKNGESVSLGEVVVVGIGENHAEMHSSIPLSANTGFFIDGRFWDPGDAYTDPKREVEILALPVAGPWMKISEAIDYALMLKPKVAFPVHDGTRSNTALTLPGRILPTQNIKFLIIPDGESEEFN